jgi:fibro-slime domain-containing protein
VQRVGSVRLGLVVAFLAAAGACSTYTATAPDAAGGEDPGGGSGNASQGGSSSKGGSIGLAAAPSFGGELSEGGCDPAVSLTCGLPPGEEGFCGDGRHDPGEACDDGNATSGDGCTATCAQVEVDFVCPTPGEPCVSTQKCGDKKISSSETCDDGQATPKDGDGCDAKCQVEKGWVCLTPGEPCQAAKCGDGIIAGNEQCEDDNAVPAPSDGCSEFCQVEDGFVCDKPGEACRATKCNDGKREGSEPCDDGNQVVGDGCTPLCQVEPKCPKTGGVCGSRCGDGLLLPNDAEECDDGNVVDGDGCSATCKVENGYACTLVQGSLPETLQLPFVFRDFISRPVPTKAPPAITLPRHPDFNGGCRGQLVEGIVNTVLDAEGKPGNSHLCDLPVDCTTSLDYVNTGDFCYQRDKCGGKTPDSAVSCIGLTHANHPLASHPTEDPFKFWYRDTDGVNITRVVPVTLFKNAQNVYTYSAPAGGLYPLDDFGWQASGDDLGFNISSDPTAKQHNYGFTTEVRYWFSFKGGETLNFSGDDDVWVFVNGHLALDMGGKHGQASRALVLNANGIATCADCLLASHPLPDTGTAFDVGIKPGNVYEIALFHAERQTAASNFKLSLTGFVNLTSGCDTVCGDGIIAGKEECDDGDKNGAAGYGGCTNNCKRGSYCGDGIVDAPDEDCDDSVNLSQYNGCAPGCKTGPSCGDGIVQSQFEECDDAKLEGAYNGCAEGCVLGPHCGDKIVQKDAGETCDDGNHQNLDGCTATCKIEKPK